MRGGGWQGDSRGGEAGDPGEHEQRQGGRARGWERQMGRARGRARGWRTGKGMAEGTGKGMEDGRGDCRRDEHRDQGGDLLRQGRIFQG